MLIQSSKLHNSSWYGSNVKPNMVPIWSKHGPDMVPKSRHSIDMFLRPYLTSLENFRALAALEVKLGQTWSKMAPTWFL